MKALKRVRGRILEKSAEGIVVHAGKNKPVSIAFSDMAQKNVSVIIWKQRPSSADDHLSVGSMVDVMWWDGPVDYSVLLGKNEGTSWTMDADDMSIDFPEEEIPF